MKDREQHKEEETGPESDDRSAILQNKACKRREGKDEYELWTE